MLTPTTTKNQAILHDYVQNWSALNDTSAIGDALLNLETELGKGFEAFLKDNFVPDIARYFRNVVIQTKLVEKAPELRDRILNLPLSHAAALMTATEEQLKEILSSGAKWTIAMLKERLSKKIVLGRVATDRDWEIAQNRLNIGPLEIPMFKARAQAEAKGGDVTTDLIVQVLEAANYKVAKLIKKPKKAKTKSPVPEDLGRLLLDRDSLKTELDNCVTEGPAKEVLRQELNQTVRKIAEATGIDQDPIVEELRQENESLRQQLAATVKSEAVEEAIVPQASTKKQSATKERIGFKKLTDELIKFLPVVISARSAIEQETRLKEFLMRFKQSYSYS